MKINLNDNDRQILDDILTQRDENFEVSQLWNNFLTDNFDALNKKAIHDLMDKEGLDERSAVEEAFFNYLQLDSSDPIIEKMKEDTNFGVIEPLEEKAFLDQPFNHIPVKKVVLGPYQLTYNYFEPYELFNDENTIADEKNNFAEKTHVSYFRTKVPYLMLMQKSEVWMSITPHEVHTMKEDIKNATGKVLTLGLGLGYYADEVSNKDDVTSVTIIEKDSKVIQLFEKNILPYFPHKEKIHIVKQDAFLYFERELRNEAYDYIFVDIYHTPEDALGMYLRFKSDEKKYNYKPAHYWIEESILCLLRRYVLTLIEEYYQGMKEEDYEEIVDEETELLQKLYRALKKQEYSSIKDILSLLSDEGLKELAKNI
jgi:hypothetical protein